MRVLSAGLQSAFENEYARSVTFRADEKLWSKLNLRDVVSRALLMEIVSETLDVPSDEMERFSQTGAFVLLGNRIQCILPREKAY